MKWPPFLSRLYDLVAEQSPTRRYIAALVLIGIITHLQWFNPLSVIEFGDWQYRHNEQVQQMLTAWNAWVPFEGFGSTNILMSGFPFRGFAWGLITNLGFSYDIATKLTLFLPVAIGGFVTPFLLGRRFFKSDWIAFCSALFYGSTAYFLIIQTAHLPIGVIYAFLPLLMLLFDRALDENKLRWWLWVTLLFCIGIFYEVRIMYIVAVLMAMYLALFLFTHKVHIKYYLKPLGICTVLLIVLNLFWLLPTKVAGAESIGEVAARGLFGDNLFTISQSLTVMKWNWTGTLVDRTFTAQPVQLHLWIVPILSLVGLVTAVRYRRRVVFFLVITLIGLLLTKQSAEPFASTYNWLYHNFPGFILFREASKFYVLVAFGYFGLIGYALVALKEREFTLPVLTKVRPYGYYAGVVAILLVAVINLKPAFTTEIGGTFRTAQMPEDYKILKRFLIEQPDYFRTYWLPREAWWGFYSNEHPRLRGVDVVGKEWKDMLEPGRASSRYDTAQNNIDIFKQPHSAELLNNGAVKYVIVPLRDRANDDDFYVSYGDDRQFFIDALDQVPYLTRLNIGTSQLAVYENKTFKPYITASDSVYQLPTDAAVYPSLQYVLGGLSEHFSSLKKDLAFSAGRLGTGFLQPLFEPDQQGESAAGKLQQKLDVPNNSSLLIDTHTRNLEYSIEAGRFKLYDRPATGLKRDGQPLLQGSVGRQLLGTAEVRVGSEYFLAFEDRLEPLGDSLQRTIGAAKGEITLSVATAENLISNPSLEDGLWQQKVDDCNNYDPFPDIKMDLDQLEFTAGKQALRLSATSHTACTGQREIAVQPGNYLFGFSYRTVGGQKVGYKVTFNDAAKTSIQSDIKSNDELWHEFRRTIAVPEGATSLSFEVRSYPDQSQQFDSLSYYDSFRLSRLTPRLTVAAETGPPELLPLPAGPATLSYEDAAFNLRNLIPNPSFEEKLWQPKVGDCHAYDSRPELAMSHAKKGSDSKRALQLEAARHIACTTPGKINVKENTNYLFGFDVQSPNAATATYYLEFNDRARTTQRKTVRLETTDWQHYTTNLTVPWGASQLSLVVYAIPDQYSKERMILRYDNFKLVEIPNVLNKFSVVTQPTTPIVKPKKIDYKIVGPTKKLVHISGATTPFYLTMSESYHDKWRLAMNNAKASGPLHSWLPIGGSDAVSRTDHLKLDNYLNAWYVDPVSLCKAQVACIQQADGSFDMEMVIEFTPQRWFLTGLLISGTAATGLGGSLWYIQRRTVAKKGK